MPVLLAPLAVSLMVFVCTFVAAVSGMVLHKKLPDDHLSGDSKDVIKLVMGLIATMAALVLGLLIASANSSYETQSGELQQVSDHRRARRHSDAIWAGGKRIAPQASGSRFSGG
jgi:hypothetical protein